MFNFSFFEAVIIMNKAELLARISDIEWEDFEVKEAASDIPKSCWETVSAFANTNGGWLILGNKLEVNFRFLV